MADVKDDAPPKPPPPPDPPKGIEQVTKPPPPPPPPLPQGIQQTTIPKPAPPPPPQHYVRDDRPPDLRPLTSRTEYRAEVADIYDRLESSAVPEVNRRAGYLPLRFIREAPFTAMGLVFSSIPGATLLRFGSELEDTWRWLREVDGDWLTARAHTLFLSDPTARAEAMNLIDSRGIITSADRASPLGSPLGAAADVLMFGDTPQGPAFSIDLAGVLGMVGKPFDWLGRRLFQLPRYPIVAAAGVTAAGLRAVGAEGAAEQVEATGESIGDWAARQGIRAYEATGVAVGRATDVTLGSVAGAGALLAETIRGEEVDFEDWKRYFWPEQPGTGFGAAVADGMGLEPEDGLYNDVAALSDFMGQWTVGSKIGGVFRAARAARRTPGLLRSEFTPEFRRSLQNRYGAAGEEVFRFLTRAPEDWWMKTRAGRLADAEIARIVAAHPDDPAGALMRAFPENQLPPEVAAAMSRAVDRGERARVWSAAVKGTPDPVARARDLARVREIEGTLIFDATLSSRKRWSLLAERVEINRRLSRPARITLDPPLLNPLAGGPISWFRRAYHDLPDAKWSRGLRAVLNPAKGANARIPVPHMVRLFDDLGDTTLHLPGMSHGRPGALSHNANLVKRYADRAGVSPAAQRRLLQALVDIPDGDVMAFYAWVDEVFSTIGSSKLIAPDMAMSFKRFRRYWDIDQAHRMMRHTDEVDASGAILKVDHDVLASRWTDPLGRMHETPLPTMSAEWLRNGISLPPISELIEATSWIRRHARAARRGNVATRASAFLAYDLPKGISEWMTSFFKPVVLTVFGLRVLPLSARIIMEERMRARMFGFGEVSTLGGVTRRLAGTRRSTRDFKVAKPSRPKTRFRGARETSPEDITFADLGSILLHDVLAVDDMTTVHRQVNTVTFSGPESFISEAAQRGLWEKMAHVHNSPEMRELIRRGPDDWVAWLTGTDDGREWLSMMEPNLRRATRGDSPESVTEIELLDTLERFAAHQHEAMRQLAGGNERLFRAMASGRWDRRGRFQEQAIRNRFGDTEAEEYKLLADDEIMAREAIGEARRAGDDATLAAYQAEHRRLLDRMEHLEKGARAGAKRHNIEEADDWIAAVMEEWGRGDYDPPETVTVTKFESDSNRMSSQNIRRGMNAALYYPFRAVAWLDVKMARGRVYKAAGRDVYDRLLAQGWNRERALAAAKVQGARVARDLMYDLSARSSAQHFTRNAFWFAPAWQEVLNTWFVKVPSQYYWPVGAAFLANRAGLLVELMHDLGFITEDENGEKVVVVPFLSNLLDRLEGPGGEVAKGIVRFNPKNLNLVTAGGLAPGLSTQYNLLLGHAARKYGGIYKRLSDIFQPYGQDVQVGPPALNYAYMAWKGEAAPWEFLSPDAQRRFYDLGADDALRQARVIVGDPPRPEDFASADGTLTAAAESDYRDAYEAYVERLTAEARDLRRANAFIRLIGATLSPTSVRTTDAYRRDATLMLESIYGAQPDHVRDNPGSEAAAAWRASPEGLAWRERRDLLYDAYLSEHPDGYFYLVAKTAVGEKHRELPYTSTGEDAFWDEFITGERRVLDPEEFLSMAMGMESLRHYTGVLNEHLAEVGTTAPDLLRNGFTRQADLLEFQQAWDRYLYFHSDFKAYRDRMFRVWAKTDPDAVRPTYTFETHRLAELKQSLRAVGNYFTVDGLRTSEYRQVVGEVGQLFAASGSFGPPSSTLERNMNWYYETVLTPYFDELEPIYNAIRQAEQEDLDTSEYWDAIRRINNAYRSKRGPDGLDYPTPEEVLWGNRSEAEQYVATLGIATRPIGWATQFQRGLVGIPDVPHMDDFFSRADDRTDEFYAYVNANDIHGSSNEYARLKAEMLSDIANIAASYGEEMTRMNELSAAPAYVRLREFEMTDNARFAEIAEMVDSAITDITNAGLSYRSWNNTSTPLKLQVFGAIDEFRDRSSELYDAEFDRLMVRLGQAWPHDDVFREGAVLYDAIWFAQPNPDYIPTDVKARY